MDTVIGCEGSHKVLLTLHFNPFEFMMAYIMDSKEADNVKAVIDHIEDSIGDILFNKVFSLILTDRGGEFQRPDELEVDSDGVIRTSIYYCDPMRSGQKGALELRHTLLRMVLPKGTSFDFLTQWDVNLIVNHINSTPRESLGGKTPYNVALETLGEEVLKAFQLKPIEPDKVSLTPKLIRFNH